jgi:glycogen debranching enzyme
MFSGWGVRTLATSMRAYNPLSYHNGSVWPHDNGIIAAGLMRYGLVEHAQRVARAVLDAAAAVGGRLPELFCGFERGLADMPVPYPVACSPQAWAAATALSLLQTMLGMRADAAHDRLELDRPHLPAWLGKVTVHELRVGEREVDLLFHRWRGGTSAEVIRKSPDLDVTIRM